MVRNVMHSGHAGYGFSGHSFWFVAFNVLSPLRVWGN